MYYYNHETGATQWECPEGVFGGGASASEAVAGPWRKHLTPEGQAYYHNPATGETSWTAPAAAQP